MGTESLEVDLLLEAVFRHYGYDFRGYSRPSITRRIRRQMEAEGVKTVSGLQERVLHDPEALERLLLGLSVSVTGMFRDPGFYVTFREKVVPMLRTYPFVRIWHAGCSTGEEVYSVAIVLVEEELYDRCRIYATDMNQAVLERAKAGVFPVKSMQEHTGNYLKARGKQAFSEYYSAKYGSAILSPRLKQNIVFAEHNLATDSRFNEFNVILCRNVMIYFDESLTAHVHELFYERLAMFGFLALGNRESIKFSPYEDAYEVVDEREKVYRKVR